jgi:predicted AAA+ superfamily ATPase
VPQGSAGRYEIFASQIISIAKKALPGPAASSQDQEAAGFTDCLRIIFTFSVHEAIHGRDECFFWATHGGAELDLLVVRGRLKIGFEIKRTSSPRVTPSMRNAMQDLNLQRLYLVHAGNDSFPLAERIQAVPFARIREDLEGLLSRGS